MAAALIAALPTIFVRRVPFASVSNFDGAQINCLEHDRLDPPFGQTGLSQIPGSLHWDTRPGELGKAKPLDGIWKQNQSQAGTGVESNHQPHPIHKAALQHRQYGLRMELHRKRN